MNPLNVDRARDVRPQVARHVRAGRLAALVITALLAVTVAACQPASTLPELFPSPEFSLVDQTGQPFSSQRIAGKVVLADFVYTSCTDICPLLSATMAQVRDQLRQAKLLGDKVMLLSFTVDPETDTPARLSEYGRRFGADPAEWRFLTGDREQVESLLIGGFKVGAPPRVSNAPGATSEIVHTNRFVLVDAQGQVRDIPNGADLDVARTVEEIRRLVPSR
ncbi:MAG: SCO family protein [Chloroflexi bacterium]|nr:SCO family protein [Chloroflexota bacterium]